MSRSYREPYWVDSYGYKGKKLVKRFANKKVRRTFDIPDGKAYRRLYDSWNIVDWKSKWNPWYSYYISPVTGEMTCIVPTPRWKARRK